MTVTRAYRRLLARFGPQGWWPLTRAGRGPAPAYHPGDYRAPRGRAALEVCAGAILAQNTAWTNAARAVSALAGEGALDCGRIERMRPKRLQALLRPSGYFVAKSVKLKRFCRAARGKGGVGRWLRARLPLLRRELLGVYGIGPETADSILLYAGGKPAFVVDAYTRRITQRLGWLEEGAGYDRTRSYLAARLPRSVKVYQEFHALFVELAKKHCRKSRPACGGCPLRGGCRRGREHG